MLKVLDIHFSYGSKPVLRGISLEVRRGEIVGLIGPNGSGKTTLLRTITRVLTSQKGKVYLNGDDAARLSQEEVARRVAVVPQTPFLPEAFTAMELVLMGRTPYLGHFRWEGERDMEIARQAMEMTDTQQFASQRIGELSGGERQRVLIARALAQTPSILLLDEPTAHLDIGHQAAIFDLLYRLQETRPLSVLAAVHDLTTASQYCHRLVMLQNGEVVADGTPQEVLTMERIGEVYGAQVSLMRHPEHGTPVVLPVSQARGDRHPINRIS